MDQQLSLFPVPLSRHSDPVTSYHAADEIHQSGRWQSQQQAVLAALKRLGEATSAEVANAMGADRHLPARRLADLRRLGFVEQGRPRRCSVTKRECMTWVVIEEN
ncbi:winged helix-turn-helix domain-containing protein [Planctomycetota bacterium]